MSLLELVKIKALFAETFILVVGYYFLRTVIFAGLASKFLESSKLAKLKKVYQIPIERAQIMTELGSNVVILLFDALIAALLLYFDLFRSSSDEAFAFFSTFLLMFVWLEIWFYISHRLLHHRALYFIHAQHHQAKVTGPLTALSFSLFERVILMLGATALPALLSFWFPLSFTGYAFYFTVNYALNIFAHLNVELIPPSWLQRPWGRVLNATSFHALHHGRYNGHFGLFTPFLDRIFGTDFTDYREVQKEAYQGRGLQRVGQRLNTETAPEL